MVPKDPVAFGLDEFQSPILEVPAVTAHGVARVLLAHDLLLPSLLIDLESAGVRFRQTYREAIAVRVVRHFSMASSL
jgi:hypothetical protein